MTNVSGIENKKPAGRGGEPDCSLPHVEWSRYLSHNLPAIMAPSPAKSVATAASAIIWGVIAWATVANKPKNKSKSSAVSPP